MPQSLALNIVHLVFSTKERYPFINKEIRSDLCAYIVGILRKNECNSIISGAVDDHVHILFILTKNRALKDVVKEVKGGSSRWLSEKEKSLKEFKWQAGYSAFSVSLSNVESVKNYIRNQEKHHQQLNFKDELKKLLSRHGVEFDEKYLWD